MIGYIAACMGVLVHLPQVIESIKLKKCGMNRHSLILLLITVVLWFMHGLMIKDTPLVLVNGLLIPQILINLYYTRK